MYTSKRIKIISAGFYLPAFSISVLLHIFAPVWVFAEPGRGDGVFYRSETRPIIVTATRMDTPAARVAENTSVVTSQDIGRLPAHDLGEVLNYIPGVDIQMNGQFGQSTAMSIRGSSARHVLLMVDGILFNTQLSGQANPTRIPVRHIERVEIVKGASSSAWGSSLGGVINAVTKETGDSPTPQGTFTSSFAEFATTENSLELSGKVAELGYFVTGSYLNSDGPLAATDVEEKKSFTKLSYALGDKAKLPGSFGYSGANVRYGPTPDNRINAQPYNTRYGKMIFHTDQERYAGD